ncbi:hypothetical protein [Nitrospirillum pindoramense]|uniref:Uncharacterized protein n=1 Tax=Nitrospirillum amazonense TaxID=28077 RepID=A0A560GVF9_9PROT|nr:hypothetical protein [Nitrospirillum amazonense]TWB38015.1 hypothetical protein FBZ90_1136 [Nitrospirillum amazonense]
MPQPLRPTFPPKGDAAYQQLWQVIDIAVRDAFDRHPEYLTAAGRHAAVTSVTKRVVGGVLAHLIQGKLLANNLRGEDATRAVMMAAVDMLLEVVEPAEFVEALKRAFPKDVSGG